MTAEELARFFHETHERLAPEFGYETRKAWPKVPENNRRLMTAVCEVVLTELYDHHDLPWTGPMIPMPSEDEDPR